MKTCIFFTGGADSTALLYDTLLNTTDEVFVVNLEHVPGGGPVQHRAAVLQWFADNGFRSFINLGDRVVVEPLDEPPTTDPDEIKRRANITGDVVLVRKILAWIQQHDGEFDQYFFGAVSGNWFDPSLPVEGNYYCGSTIEIEFAAHGFSGTITSPLRDRFQDKPHIVAMLPKDLFDLTITCAKFEGDDEQPCGVCKRCRYRKIIEHKIRVLKQDPDVVQRQYEKARKIARYQYLRVAAGEPLTLPKEERTMAGWSNSDGEWWFKQHIPG